MGTVHQSQLSFLVTIASIFIILYKIEHLLSYLKTTVQNISALKSVTFQKEICQLNKNMTIIRKKHRLGFMLIKALVQLKAL